MKPGVNEFDVINTKKHMKSQLMKLSIEQLQAIDQLMMGKNDREVAEAVGVSRETITRWRLYHPAFQAELNRRRTELWNISRDSILQLIPQAIDALSDAINDFENPNRWKVAIEILKLIELPKTLIKNPGPQDPEEIITKLAEGKQYDGLLSTMKPNGFDYDMTLEDLGKKLEKD